MPFRAGMARYYGREWREVHRPAILARAVVGVPAQLAELAGLERSPALRAAVRALLERPAGPISRCECRGECGALEHARRCPELDRIPAIGFRGLVILTIAHLDQRPWHNDHANLRAFCQACHNRVDAPFRALHGAETRAARREAELRAAGQLALPFPPQLRLFGRASVTPDRGPRLVPVVRDRAFMPPLLELATADLSH